MPLPFGTLQTLGPTFMLTQQQDGNTFLFGGMPSLFEVGGLGLDFVPDDAFSGSITILGCGATKEESDAAVTPMPYPFRAHYLNGQPSDLSMQMAGTVVSSLSSLLIPASGKQIGMLVACSAGTATIYTQAVVGATAP